MANILTCDLGRNVFHFLQESERLRLMATSKRFAPLRKERLEVAKEALERLRKKFPKLFFRYDDLSDPTGWKHYNTYTVRMYRGDPDIGVPGDLGLLRITHVRYGYTSRGVRFDQGPSDYIFSPWACAFVYPETHEEDDDRPVNADADERSLHSRLVQISRRVV
jgi:hypothetical protein